MVDARMTETRHAGEERLTLRDGHSVAVRPCHEPDAAGIAALVRGLSGESRAMRFGAARRGLSAEEAAAMAAPPGPGGVGLVALAGDAAERVVALARYDRRPGAPEAELALAVADAWHGLGLGTGLIESLRRWAAADGLDALWALVRPDNHKMLTVFRTLGGAVHVRHGADECLVRLPLGSDDALEEAGAARFAAAAAASLEPLFRPRSIAVVGASRDAASPGGAAFGALLASGFSGPLHPVNRAAAAIAGRRAYTSLAAVPDVIDLVVVAVPAAEVPAVARQAANHGARALVVLSSGFSETGPVGAALEAELLHVVRTTGLRMVGPNCLGVAVSGEPGAAFDASFAPRTPPRGRIAFASQSGGLGVAALEYCAARGLGLSAFVSLGNKADVSANDLLAWWERDPSTDAVLLYLEGFGNPRRFARLARRVGRSTPVVALKAGRGTSGRRAAGSHTAALAAGDAPTDALFDLAGVVRVRTLGELLDTGALLGAQPPPTGDRVGILANSGGPAILAADASEAAGLAVPDLSPSLRAALARAAPGVAGASNPVDLGAGAGAGALAAAGRAMVASGEVDALIVLWSPLRGGDLRAAMDAAEGLGGSLCVVGCLMGGRPAAANAERPSRVPWLETPEGAALALANAWRAEAARWRPPDPAVAPDGIATADARRRLQGCAPGAWLTPDALTAVLGAYGIRSARQAWVDGPEAAAAAQAEIAGPVAVKLVSPTVTHKSEVGGVVLGCRSPEAAAAAVRRIAASLARIGRADEMQGALVQEMASAGPDLIVGGLQDPVFGPVVLAGIGGAEAELWGDRSVALAPVGPATAGELWGRLRGSALLDGWRGAPAVPRGPLEELTRRVSWLLADQPLIAELDLNPVRAGADGRTVALDARALRAPAP